MPHTYPMMLDVTGRAVVIVGGGFTGFSAALHLAERGTRVVLLEGAEIGYGGSGRNVGLVNAGMWVMPDELPGVLGDLYGSRLLELLGNAPRLVFGNGRFGSPARPEFLLRPGELLTSFGAGLRVVAFEQGETATPAVVQRLCAVGKGREWPPLLIG